MIGLASQDTVFLINGQNILMQTGQLGSRNSSSILGFGTGSTVRLLGEADDLGNPVVQINFDGDLLILDGLSSQEVGIGHGQCPGLPFFCLKRDCPLILIHGYDPAAAEDSCRVASRDCCSGGNDQADGQNRNHAHVHCCTS